MDRHLRYRLSGIGASHLPLPYNPKQLYRLSHYGMIGHPHASGKCTNVLKINRSRAFTLIELLIVVAIITILAAIAVPNFLEAQTRSKVSRVKSDMRSLASSLETYCIDNNMYPPSTSFFTPMPSRRFEPLTTPLSYMTSVPRDPFERHPGHNYEDAMLANNPAEPLDVYLYNPASTLNGAGTATGAANRMSYSITSGGPDLTIQFPYFAFADSFLNSGTYSEYIYDPTNGAVSGGEIFRRGGAAREPVPGIDGQ